MKAEKRVSNGLQFLAHYTFSMLISMITIIFSVNKKFAWGPNGFNPQQVIVG